jgi:hypothetical protein
MFYGGRSMMYTLDDSGQPSVALDIVAWGAWLDQSSRDGTRRVGLTNVGPFVVSTVFLGMDHSLRDTGLPVLWETMIFGLGDDEEYCERYTSREAAEQGHAEAVALATEKLRALESEGDP